MYRSGDEGHGHESVVVRPARCACAPARGASRHGLCARRRRSPPAPKRHGTANKEGAMATVEQELRYRVVEGWEKAPANANRQDAVGVGVDSRGRVYLVTRVRSQVLVYEQDGTFVAAWGEGQFTDRTHGLTVAPDDTVWVVDDGAHTVRKYTADGKFLLELEARGRPAAESGYDGRTLESIARGGPPFNRPTNVAVAPNGELYVSDG